MRRADARVGVTKDVKNTSERGGLPCRVSDRIEIRTRPWTDMRTGRDSVVIRDVILRISTCLFCGSWLVSMLTRGADCAESALPQHVAYLLELCAMS